MQVIPAISAAMTLLNSMRAPQFKASQQTGRGRKTLHTYWKNVDHWAASRAWTEDPHPTFGERQRARAWLRATRGGRP